MPTEQRVRRGPLGVTWQLCRVAGVPIELSPSWLLVVALLTAVYGPIIEDFVAGISSVTAYVTALVFGVLFGLCVLAHEVGHTLVSRRLGYPVARVVLFALGGVSELEAEPDRPRDEFLIAVAGPLVSLALAGAAWGLLQAAPDGTLLVAVLSLLFGSNLLLAAFNLLPGLPLDGGRLLRSIICALGASPLAGTRAAGWTGRLLAVAVAVFGVFVDRGTVGVAGIVFALALGAYLWFGATQALRAADLRARLPGIAVASLVRPAVAVPAAMPLAEALRRAGECDGVLLVVDPVNRPVALVEEAAVAAVPPERRPWTPVSAVARGLEPALVLPTDIDATALLARVESSPARAYLIVYPDGTPAGVIRTRDFGARLTGRTRRTGRSRRTGRTGPADRTPAPGRSAR